MHVRSLCEFQSYEVSLNRIAAEKSHHVPKAFVFSRLGIKMVPCVIFLQLGSVQKV